MKEFAPAATTAFTGGAALIGWQTLLADLSLILFMVTAAAMSEHAGRPAAPALAAPKLPCNPALGEPLAVWRAGGSQTLARWLAREQPDARQQLTISAHYPPGGEAGALAAAQALVSQAGAMGKAARVIIAPATGPADDELQASLAYDRPAVEKTARGLLHAAGTPSTRTSP